ncbi:MAG: c-type cytochrome [bacterium]
MKYLLRYVAYTLAALLVLAVVGYSVMSYRVYQRTSRHYDISVDVPQVKHTKAMIDRGRHVARIRSCADCHGANYGGETFIDDPLMGSYTGSNLTSGEGGVADDYEVRDWARAIRHGLGPDSKPLIFMPSYEFDNIGDKDLAALIAFFESLPPVDNRPSAIRIGPMSKFLYLTGGLPQLVSAEIIDHEKQRVPAPEPAVSLQYGKYLASSCKGCHGENLSGGPIPGVPPSWPRAPNLTPHETGLADWTYDEFVTMMRKGKTPGGRTVNSQYMPWKNFRHMSDTEVKALWTYLESLEARPTGSKTAEQ